MSRHVCVFGIISLLAVCGLAADRPDIGDEDEQSPAKPDLDGEITYRIAGESWRFREQALGDMGGFRSMLARHGMSLEIENLDEGFGTTNGGSDSADEGRYAGLTDVIFSLDTESAGWWNGGVFVIDLQNVRGDDISEVVGDIQGVSNIVGPPGTRFVEYYLDQSLADGRFRLKIGKQDANADFVVSSGGGEFINSSFGIVPTVPLPTFPAPALGIVGGWSPSDVVSVKAGYWDGEPETGSGASTAVFDGSRGTVGAVEIEITPFGGAILDGTFKVGVWRHSDVELPCPPTKESAEVVTEPADGIYFTADQGLWENGDRRLAFFAQGGWSETDRSAVGRYFGGGLIFTGPFRSRPDDIAGIGIAYADIGRKELPGADCTSETVVELFYKLPVTGWMTLNPDLQWIDRPSGYQGSAFVAGLRVATVF